MKRIFKHFLMLAATTAAFAACKPQEDVVPSLEDAELTFRNLTEGQEVFGKLSLSAVPGEEVEFDQLTFYVNDSAIVTDTEAPFEAEWNTHSLPDGSYNLKLVGQKDEMTKEVALTVNVNNSLILIDVKIAQEAYEYEQVYAFITDQEGQLVNDYVSLNPNEQVGIRRPEGFEETTFDLHIFRGEAVEEGQTPQWAGIFTYQDMEPGEIIIGSLGIFYTDTPSGTATVRVANYSEVGNGRISLNSMNTSVYRMGLDADSMMVYKVEFYSDAATPLLGNYNYWDQQSQNRYLLTEKIAPGDEITIDFNDFVEAEASQEFAVPDALSYSYSTSGFTADSNYPYYIKGHSGRAEDEETSFKLTTLPDFFSSYLTDAWIKLQENQFHYQRKYSTEVNPTLEPMSAQVMDMSYQDGMASIKTVGSEYDYYTFWLNAHTYDEQNGASYFDWEIYTDRQEQTIPFPEIPAELAAHYAKPLNLEMSPFEVEFVDVKDWNNKSDFYKAAFETGNAYQNYFVIDNYVTANRTDYRVSIFGMEETNAAARSMKRKKTRRPSFRNRPSLSPAYIQQ